MGEFTAIGDPVPAGFPQLPDAGGSMIYDFENARVMTVRPPMSHAIAYFGKPVENRTKGLSARPWTEWGPNGIRTLFIHAGLTYDHPMARAITSMGHTIPHNIAYGAVVAVVNVSGICNKRMNPTIVTSCACGPWSVRGQFHWQLTDVWALDQPVPMRGHQGLRRAAPDIRRRVQYHLSHHPV
jgi:hypothetical protein